MSNLVRDAVFWIAVACCAVGSVAILRLTLAAPTPGAVGSAHRLPRSSRAIEITWVVMPMVALAALLWWTRVEMRRAGADAAREAAVGAVHEQPSTSRIIE